MSQSQFDVQRRLSDLRAELHHHNHCYHVLDAPEVSDAEYDALFDELLRLEAQHPETVVDDSPSQRVGAPPAVQFENQHPLPMLSLDKYRR